MWSLSATVDDEVSFDDCDEQEVPGIEQVDFDDGDWWCARALDLRPGDAEDHGYKSLSFKLFFRNILSYTCGCTLGEYKRLTFIETHCVLYKVGKLEYPITEI